ncbi:RIP metalloprotease RseP [Rubeoparvulum massiliense]|uniref:RIP metalloprotease RseP n=1 Tax=Rubeoparvulum massiliense TaxID=1631346 RepID=UPI00065E98C6|nr:RIP metalloprotease RseP [Rubeoparvulum massiliense]
MNITSILAFIFVFGLLVASHEFGHFIVAKRSGILCREFAIGMGPKILSIQKGETRYTLRLLPIGGYVRMAGQDPEMDDIKRGQTVGLRLTEEGKVKEIVLVSTKLDTCDRVGEVSEIDLAHQLKLQLQMEGEAEEFAVLDDAKLIYAQEAVQIAPFNRQFGGQSVRKRAASIFAGPLFNMILAFIILLGIFLMTGVPSDQPIIGQVAEQVTINGDTMAAPAKASGLQANDRITSVNGTPTTTWMEMVEEIRKYPNQEVSITYERNGVTESTIITPIENNGNGYIGVSQAKTKSILGSITNATTTTYDYSVLILKSVGMLVTGEVSWQELSGPVGIFEYTSDFAAMGLVMLLNWTAILSVNLGIFNLLPFPALDGGRLVFIGVEALRGRPIDPKKEWMVNLVGLALLMLLVIAVTWKDIERFYL